MIFGFKESGCGRRKHSVKTREEEGSVQLKLPGFLKSPLSFLNLLNLEVYQRNPQKGFMTADGRGGQPETKNKTKFEKKMYR